jgi:hypothetical protein
LWITNREKREKRERVLWFRGTVLLNHFNGRRSFINPSLYSAGVSLVFLEETGCYAIHGFSDETGNYAILGIAGIRHFTCRRCVTFFSGLFMLLKASKFWEKLPFTNKTPLLRNVGCFFLFQRVW